MRAGRVEFCFSSAGGSEVLIARAPASGLPSMYSSRSLHRFDRLHKKKTGVEVKAFQDKELFQFSGAACSDLQPASDLY